MKLNQPAALRRANIDPYQVASLLNELSSDMILVHGFVHGNELFGQVFERR